MQQVRIIEIPKMKAAYSGPLTDEARFEAFNTWFSRFHAALPCELFPRDFMWYNERIGAQEWFYALGGERRQIPPLPQRARAAGALSHVSHCLSRQADASRDFHRRPLHAH